MIFKFTSQNDALKKKIKGGSHRLLASLTLILCSLFFGQQLFAQCTTNVLNTNVVLTTPSATMDAATMSAFVTPTGGIGCLELNFYLGGLYIPGDGTASWVCDGSENNVTTFPPGNYMVVADDDNVQGGSESPLVMITVSFDDVTNPIIVCPADVAIECDESSDPSNTGAATATDNCTVTGNIIITWTDASTQGVSGCSQHDYTITRTWRATDEQGNSSVCDQTITVDDTTDPLITSCADVTVDCDTDLDPATSTNLMYPLATDNCSAPADITFTFVDGPPAPLAPPNDCVSNFSFDRTWTAMDECGNASVVCVQTITVMDMTDPVIVCAPDITLECDQPTSPSPVGSFVFTASPNTAWADATTGLVASEMVSLAGIPAGAVVTGVYLDIGMDHSWIGDLVIDVVSPGLTENVLSSLCGNDSNISATFDEWASGPAVCSGYDDGAGDHETCPGYYLVDATISGNVQPAGNFDNFIGQPLTNGDNWFLNITDNTGGDGGCLHDFGITIDWIVPMPAGHATATDNCSAPTDITLTWSDVSTQGVGCDFNNYTITRTWTATDECGLSDQCVQTITVVDTTIPSFTVFPSDMTQPNDVGNCDNTISWPTPTTDDNCPGETLTVEATDPKGNTGTIIINSGGGTDFADFPVGISTVEYTVTDACSNSTMSSFTVTIEDTEAPVVTCPPNDLLHFASCNTDAMLGDYRGLLGVNDNCPTGFTIVQSPAPGTLLSALSTPADGETIDVTFTVTDNAANNLSNSCTFTLTLDEDNDPTPTTAGGILDPLFSECGPLIVTAPTAVDACGNLICGVPFPTVATYLGPDCGAPTGPCISTTRSSTDTPLNITDNDFGGINSVISVVGLDPIIEDVNISLTSTHTWVGDLTVTLTSPNGTTVELFNQPGAPATNFGFGCDQDNMDVTFDDDAVTGGVENVCNPSVTGPGVAGPPFAISGTFNSVVPLAMFNNENPNGDWVLNISDNAAGDLGTLDSWTLELCTNATSTQVPQYEFPVGQHDITWVYDDGNGNTAQQLQEIDVFPDTEAPTASCEDVIVYLDANGNAALGPFDVLTPSGVNLVGGDNQNAMPAPFNSGLTELQITVPFATTFTFDWDYFSIDLPGFDFAGYIVNGTPTALTGTSGDSGSEVVNLNGGDVFGFYVFTVDNLFGPGEMQITNFSPGFSGALELPNWTLLNNNADGFFNAIPGSATDNCTDPANLAFSLVPNTFNCTQVGAPVPVSVLITDEAGNEGVCSSIVTVLDTMPPALFNVPAPSATVHECGNLPDTLGYNVFATDNCDIIGINYNETDDQTGNPDDCGNYNYTLSRIWTATDVNGNTASAVETLMIEDNTDPVISPTFVSNINVTANQNDCFANVALTIDPTDYSDNCAADANLTVTNNAPFGIGDGGSNASGNYPLGTTAVTFTVTDPCGNQGMATVNVTVIDGIAPVVLCSVNSISIPPGVDSVVILPSYMGSFSDNCGLDTVFVTPNVFYCDQTGQHTVTLTAVDEGGLMTSCQTTVEIQDLEPPVAICQNFTVGVDENGQATIQATDIDNGSWDACSGVASLDVFPSTFNTTNFGTNIVTLTVTDSFGTTATCTANVEVTYPPTCFHVGGPGNGVVNGGAGEIIQVPITVTNFTHVSSFQLPLEILDADVAEFVGVNMGSIHPQLESAPGIFDSEIIQTDSFISDIDSMIIVGSMGQDSTVYDTIYTPEYDQIVISWQNPNHQTILDGETIFFIEILLTGDLNDFSFVDETIALNGSESEVSYIYGTTVSPNLMPCVTDGVIVITQILIAGDIYDEDGQPANTVDVDLNVLGGINNPIEVDQTGPDGAYSFIVTNSGDYQVFPHKNLNWPNGVNSADVSAIQQHAVGCCDTLATVYRKIAGDVNDDLAVSTFDALLLNQYVASAYTLPPPAGAPSWRFVPAAQMLLNDASVIVPLYDESIVFMNLQSDTLDNDFIAIKMGDVTGDANPQSIVPPDADPYTSDKVYFHLQDRDLIAGEVIDVEVTADQFKELLAYQWILQFDPSVLRFDDVLMGDLPALSGKNFGLSLLEQGMIVMTWYEVNTQSMKADEVLFTYRFEVLKDGMRLSELMSIGQMPHFESVAFGESYEPHNVELRFTDSDDELSAPFALLQNTPNPFKDETIIGFYLPESTKATLLLTDVTGRQLKSIEIAGDKGYNEVVITKGDLPASGVIHYQLKTNTHHASRQMIIVE